MSPAKLTPLGNDDLPSLHPYSEDAAAQSNETPSTYPPPPVPQPRAPIPFRTSYQKELAKSKPLEPPKAHASFSGIKGLMPPPGIKRHALGDIVGLDGPEYGVVGESGQPEAVVPVTADPTPLPSLDDPNVPANTSPGGPDEGTVAPPTTQAPPNNIPADSSQQFVPGAVGVTPAMMAPQQTPGDMSALPGEGPQAANAAAPTTGVKDALSQYEQIRKPIAQGGLNPGVAPNNWAQRLGLAALALTRFAPVANQLIHPKWSDQQRQYQAALGDVETAAKQEETAATTQAQVEQRNAAAEKAREYLANTQLLTQQRLQTAEDRIKAQKSETNRKFLEDRLKGRESDSQYQPQSAPMPPGYEFIQDPANPGFGFAAPPAWSAATADLVPFMGGRRVGDMVPQSEIKAAALAKNNVALAGAKKPDAPQLSAADAMVLRAAGGDPGKGPTEQPPGVIEKFLALKKENPNDGGTWTIEEDSQGHPIEHNSKTGAVRPVTAPGGVQKTGTFQKQQDANTKELAPAKAAYNYANDYVNNGIYTGSGDEALQEKFFELAKPTTGFRMTQPQMDMLQNSRSWMASLEAKARHATTGTWFNDQQRKQIVNTMRDLAKAKGLNVAGGPAPAIVATPSGAVDLNQFHRKPNQ